MKTKKQTLKDKRQELSNYGLQYTESLGGSAKFYSEEDVEKAVKELKERLNDKELCCVYCGGLDEIPCTHTKESVVKIIDEIFGELGK
jgi:vacuolar-type H+-ATPase subunit E/Vma4